MADEPLVDYSEDVRNAVKRARKLSALIDWILAVKRELGGIKNAIPTGERYHEIYSEVQEAEIAAETARKDMGDQLNKAREYAIEKALHEAMARELFDPKGQ